MIDFDKRLKKEYLQKEKMNARWSGTFRHLQNKQKYILLKLFLMNPFNPNNRAKKQRWDKMRIYDLIHHLNFSEISDEQKIKSLNQCVESGLLQSYNIDEESKIIYLTSRDGTTYSVKRLSDFLQDQERLCEILQSKKRLHQCHAGSVNLSYIFDKKADIVIGYMRVVNDKNQLLHTWIEHKISGDRVVVIDYTLNAIMEKEAYYKLMNLQPINRFKTKHVKRDVKRIRESEYRKVDLRAYLLYRDELMREIENTEENKEKLS